MWYAQHVAAKPRQSSRLMGFTHIAGEVLSDVAEVKGKEEHTSGIGEEERGGG